MRETLDFKPGIPVRMSLEFTRGRKVRSGMILFLLQDRKMMFLEPYTAWKLYQMNLKPGEPFEIVKRWNGVTGSGCIVRWDVNRLTEAKPKSNLVVMPVSVPARFASTGTDGPRRRTAPGGANPPSRGPIPLDVAFREAVRIVQEGAAADGVVWGDIQQARTVATILEIAAENGWLAPWERDAA